MDNIKFSKFCNNLFKSENENENQDEYIDLNNHVFRLNYLLENINIKSDELPLNKIETEVVEKFAKEFFNNVRKNTKIDVYLNNKKREFNDYKSKLKQNKNKNDVEYIEIDDTETCKKIEVEKKDVSMIQDVSNISLLLCDTKLDDVMLEKAKNSVEAFLKLFIKDGNDDDSMTELFINILNEKNIEFIKTFCMQLVENLVVGTESEKYELKFIQLANCLSNLSSTITYSKLILILKYLFSNYLISLNLNKNTNQIETFKLTKNMIIMCSNLFKSFPSQFTEACFIEWIRLLVIECKTKNNTNIEFLLKLFKDLFSETEALLLLNFFIRQHINETWNEDFYIFLNNIFEKIVKLSISDLILIVNKMKNDCNNFSKSLAFAKFLSTVIKKLKIIIENNEELKLENEYFEKIQQNILFIIEKNDTLMKKKLFTMLD
jgi:hypothetical protein